MQILPTKYFADYYPFLKYAKNWCGISDEDGQALKTSEKINILHPFGRQNQVSIKLLTDIANNVAVFEYVKKAFSDLDETSFYFCFENEILEKYPFSRSELIKGLEIIANDGVKLGLQPIERKNANSAFENLKQMFSIENLLKNYENRPYKFKIDKASHTFSCTDFINFLTLPEDQFNLAVENFKNYTTDHTLEEYLYALSTFVHQEQLFEKAYFTNQQIERYYQIFSYNIADFESLDELIETDNPYLEKTSLSPELRSIILKDMPEHYDDLQKSIYIYLKLCQTLSYSSEYFAVNQKGDRANIYKDINYLPNITPENNEAVCYQIAAIQGKLMSETTNTTHSIECYNKLFDDRVYGNFHTYLKFRCGKFLIEADTIKSIFCSDLTLQKIGRPLTGLNCINNNQETVQQFKKALSDVIEDIKTQTIEEASSVLPSTFQDSLAEYKNLTQDEQVNIDINSRLSFLLEQVQRSQLEGMDALSYMIILSKNVFSKDERIRNVTVNVIREQQDLDNDENIQSSAIITLSRNYREPQKYQCDYKVYRPDQGVEDILIEDLIERFENHTFSYISRCDENVPGIPNNASTCINLQ